MTKPYIEFRKQRDFSAILTDTFAFIRSEFKQLIKTIFNVAGSSIVIFLITLAAYNYIAGDLFNFSSYDEPSFNSGSIALTLIVLVCYIVSAIATYILTVSTTLFYIKSYIANKGEINIDDIKKNTYSSFWSFFGLSFLKGITIGVALALCILPVFYAMVPMAIVFSIYVFESNRSATDAYSASFKLVNTDFWTAFGSFILLGIIYYILSLVFSVPTIIYTFINFGIFSGEVDPSNFSSFSSDPVLIVLNVLNTFFQFLLNIILVIGGAVIYFHLHEKTNFTGTYDKISEIGIIED